MGLVTVCVSAGWLGHRYGSYRVRGFPGSLPAAAGRCGDAVNSAELDGAGCEECLSSFWKKRTQPWRSAVMDSFLVGLEQWRRREPELKG